MYTKVPKVTTTKVISEVLKLEECCLGIFLYILYSYYKHFYTYSAPTLFLAEQIFTHTVYIYSSNRYTVYRISIYPNRLYFGSVHPNGLLPVLGTQFECSGIECSIEIMISDKINDI